MRVRLPSPSALLQRIDWRLVMNGAIALAVIAALVALWLNSERFMPLRQVEAIGALNKVTPAQLQAVVAPLAAEGFLRVDVSAVRDQVQAMTWVRSAAVRRVWPDTLAIEIEEHKPLAVWIRGGLVDDQGKLFAGQASEVAETLPVFNGIETLSKTMVEQYRAIKPQLDAVELRVTSIEVNERRAWTVKLDNGIELVLGRELKPEQITRFVKIYPQVLAPRLAEIARVDLRYTNGMAVQWKMYNEIKGSA
ncbi:MAG: cell division protein FtsQ/DivIB [Pseudomonadota bacterium]